MLCQNCNLNEASIHLYTNVNGNQQQVDLCQHCYKIIKSDPENPLNQFNQAGGSNFFDDFFSDLNNFRSSSGDLPNTPPTQEGGNRGNGGPGRPGGPRQQSHSKCNCSQPCRQNQNCPVKEGKQHGVTAGG